MTEPTHPHPDPPPDPETENAKPSRAGLWVITVLALLLVLYPFSYAPVCAWRFNNDMAPDSRVMDIIYTPLDAAVKASPEPVREAYRRYERWCTGRLFRYGHPLP